ncbi:hypothetical protein LG3211_2224 [Lysobacter gummosus]|nr:hypothetical protein LG3211_2224 [Lysobacter gummosus]
MQRPPTDVNARHRRSGGCSESILGKLAGVGLRGSSETDGQAVWTNRRRSGEYRIDNPGKTRRHAYRSEHYFIVSPHGAGCAVHVRRRTGIVGSSRDNDGNWTRERHAVLEAIVREIRTSLLIAHHAASRTGTRYRAIGGGITGTGNGRESRADCRRPCRVCSER